MPVENQYIESMQRKKRTKRSQSGVLLGTISMVLAFPLLVTTMLLSIDCGLANFYAKRLRLINKQVAAYMVNNFDQEYGAVQAKLLTEKLCQVSGLRMTNIEVKVEAATVEGAEGITMKVTARSPLLLCEMLPPAVTISSQVFEPLPLNRRFAQLNAFAYPFVNVSPSRGWSVYLPIVRPKSNMPVWSFGADDTIESLHLVQGEAPTVRPSSSVDYFEHRESLY